MTDGDILIALGEHDLAIARAEGRFAVVDASHPGEDEDDRSHEHESAQSWRSGLGLRRQARLHRLTNLDEPS